MLFLSGAQTKLLKCSQPLGNLWQPGEQVHRPNMALEGAQMKNHENCLTSETPNIILNK